MELPEPIFDVVVRPYRSLHAFGFRLLMTVLIAANGAFGIFMAMRGAWPVTGFMGLDVLGVYIAFRLSYAQASAFERITIADKDLVVAQVDARGRAREWRCPSYWASIGLDEENDERGVLTVMASGSRSAGSCIPMRELAWHGNCGRRSCVRATSLRRARPGRGSIRPSC